mmetsp:Transcript_6907/g.7949  ORF Transcript_6907/g.7949 Transcript_6907/m.7949 type:complete len:130 (+) Transcript_6907:2-391(+)
MFSRVIKKRLKCELNPENSSLVCPTFQSEQMTKWPTSAVYPLPWHAGTHMRNPFEAVIEKYHVNLDDPSSSIMIHLWHRHSKRGEAKMCLSGFERYKESFIGHLKTEYCPIVTEAVFSLSEGENGYCEF